MKWLLFVLTLSIPSWAQTPKPNVSPEFAKAARRAILAYRENTNQRAESAYQDARLAMDPHNRSEILGLAHILNYSMTHATAQLSRRDSSSAETKCYAALDEMFRERTVGEYPAPCREWKP